MRSFVVPSETVSAYAVCCNGTCWDEQHLIVTYEIELSLYGWSITFNSNVFNQIELLYEFLILNI